MAISKNSIWLMTASASAIAALAVWTLVPHLDDGGRQAARSVASPSSGIEGASTGTLKAQAGISPSASSPRTGDSVNRFDCASLPRSDLTESEAAAAELRSREQYHVARSTLISKIAASPDENERAASVFMSAIAGLSGEAVANCQGSACEEELFRRRKLAAAGPVTQLASLASTAKSPAVYGWALTTCGLTTNVYGLDVPACSSISVSRWAELAPLNAWAWMAVAKEAMINHDYSGVENAMFRASNAKDWRSPGSILNRVIANNLSGDIPMVAQVGLLSDGSIASGLEQYSGLDAFSSYCTAAALDSNRRQSCARLAESLLDHSESITHVSVAARVAKQVSLDSRDLAQVQAELDNAASATRVALSDRIDDQKAACMAVARKINYLRLRATAGERAAIRAQTQ